MVVLLVLTTIVLFLTIDYFVQRSRAMEPETVPSLREVPIRAFEPDLASVPAGTFVAPGHAWMRIATAGDVEVGVDGLAGVMLEEIERASVRRPGTEVRRGDPIAVLERGDRAITVRSPVDGVIRESNTHLYSDPDAIGRDPFGAGWLAKLAPKDLGASMARALFGDDAIAWMRRELRDFRDAFVATPAAVPVPTLPDGGLPARGIGSTLDPKAFDALATRLFDPEGAVIDREETAS